MSEEAKKDQAKETELPERQLEQASGGAGRSREFYEALVVETTLPALDRDADESSASDKLAD